MAEHPDLDAGCRWIICGELDESDRVGGAPALEDRLENRARGDGVTDRRGAVDGLGRQSETTVDDRLCKEFPDLSRESILNTYRE